MLYIPSSIGSAFQVLPGYGNSTGIILMDDVNCFSYETKILDCTYNTSPDCYHYKDVGVICNQQLFFTETVTLLSIKLHVFIFTYLEKINFV